MINILSAIAAVLTIGEIIKEKTTPVIPKENWENTNLIQDDLINPNCTHEQFMKNLKDGKYIKKKSLIEPHRDSNGCIIIDNKVLYWKDLNSHNYSHEQMKQFVESGKYNLTIQDKKQHDLQLEQDTYKKLNCKFIATATGYVKVYTDKVGNLRYYNTDEIYV